MGLQVSGSTDQSCIWGMFHSKFHVICKCCPRPNITLQALIHSQKQYSCYLNTVFHILLIQHHSCYTKITIIIIYHLPVFCIKTPGSYITFWHYWRFFYHVFPSHFNMASKTLRPLHTGTILLQYYIISTIL